MKRKYLLSFFALGIIAVFSAFCIFGETAEQDRCRRMLKEYGWETEDIAEEIENITVPAVFDSVYERYNELQLEVGFDLREYCGKKGRRYTYVVTNYPIDVGETVYANVICINGTPIAGDIMTRSMNGFMSSLIMPDF